MNTNRTCLKNGIKDGLPIALGYLVVSFTLGIAARNAGLSALQTLVASVTNNASAGEYAGFALIAAGGTYLEVAVMTLITNARYLLMSCSLSQKLPPETPLVQRALLAYDITDEIFGISVARPGWLNPWYTFGVVLVALPAWGLGGLLGAVLGDVLPARAVSALGVGLYGMFLAIIIPQARYDRVIAGVVGISFAASFAASSWQLLSGVSSGIKTIVLTVVISLAAALLFPVKEDETYGA